MENENNNGSPEVQGLSEHEIRVKKVKSLREAGIEPWPYREKVTATCEQVKKEYVQNSEKSYDVAGRILTVRLHGKTGFCTIQDRSGRLQIYIKKDLVGEESFEFFTMLRGFFFKWYSTICKEGRIFSQYSKKPKISITFVLSTRFIFSNFLMYEPVHCSEHSAFLCMRYAVRLPSGVSRSILIILSRFSPFINTK